MEGKKLIEQYDDLVIRCPRVGGDVNFLYCRSENNMLPCGWIVGCWQNKIDINRFLEEHYSGDELARIFALPKPRVESLLKMIEKAKERKKKES